MCPWGEVPCTPPPPMTLLSWGLDWGVSPMSSGLLHRQPFTIWGGGARVSLGGVPCVPLPPVTLLPRGLTARIQKRIFLLGRTYAMGFDWQSCTLHSSMGGELALRHLHPRAAPLFRCFGIIMGGLHSPPLLLLVIMGGLQPSSSHSTCHCGGSFFLFLFRWDYEGQGRILASATCLGGLCFYDHSSVCHSCITNPKMETLKHK